MGGGEPEDPRPGYYRVHQRAIRIREWARMQGLLRLPSTLLAVGRMRPSGGIWMPTRSAEQACAREDLSPRFWAATEATRAAFGALGYTECVLSRPSRSLSPLHLDSGGITYVDSTRTVIASVVYTRTRIGPPVDTEAEAVLAAVSVALGEGALSVVSHGNVFDPAPGNALVVLRSASVSTLHRALSARVQQCRQRPRVFASDDQVLSWLDGRELAALRDRVARGLLVRLTDAEVADAERLLAGGLDPTVTGDPPAVAPTTTRRVAGWALSAAISAILLRCLRAVTADHRSGEQQERLCRRLLAIHPHREARVWLQQGKDGDQRNLGEQTPEDSRAVVDTLYRLGVTDVQAVDIGQEPGWGESCNTLVAALPGDPRLRRQILRYADEQAASQGFDGVPDEGQRHVLLYKFKLSAGQMRRALGAQRR
jgi:hypothetical protein